MSALAKVKVGVIGCGKISSIYLESPRTFDILDIVACSDLFMERAREQAERYGIPDALTVEELLAHPQIELVINLTVPKAHFEVGMAVIEAGKSLYTEKPLSINREQGHQLLEAARARGMHVGGAPDTFLGAGLQTCRQLIDEGAIGTPVAANAFIMNHGAEHWHPDPDFFYQPGAGPLFDMGPYYLTALVNLLGPIRRVTGSAKITSPERIVTSEAKYGTKISVNTPTHIAGLLDFANGATGVLVTSFDVWSHSMPFIEIYGTEGTLSVPDPNTFGGPVRLRLGREKEWHEIPLTHPYSTNSRGLGAADMAYGLRTGLPYRASGELTYHILDAMQSILEASTEGRHIELTSTCKRPAPLPPEKTLAEAWESVDG
ncbi:MAG TPA: Gfo/Idh/MocA family oxidoreductase [Ktedonobacteraceae bacterium]|nr:Gfo/Idh/MocA family oxidoreductase [Ktedonobacteraceae bacterium]